MSEIEQVDQLRTAGKTVAKACKQVGISVPNYYTRRKVNNGARHEEDKADAERPPTVLVTESSLREIAAEQYFAIRLAIRCLDLGDTDGARKVLVAALTV